MTSKTTSKQSTWVDFKELRAKLSFRQLLRDYSVELKVRGERASGFCPLPGHDRGRPPSSNGKRRSPSFSADLAKGIFKCFSCQAQGNALDFAALMEGQDPSDARSLRQVALKLQDRYGLSTRHPPGGKASTPSDASSGKTRKVEPPDADQADEAKADAHENAGRAATRPAVVNAPLDFELRGLDPSHPYLKERGFTSETIAPFGLGYCSRGLMESRIAIPLHDAAGRLVGYAGRLVDDAKVDADHPKYLFPGTRERQGQAYEFRKSLFLYNGHRAGNGLEDLVVVEGFTGVWWLHQHGYRSVVALMGSDVSAEQARLIVEATKRDGRVWAFTDGDKAGERCAQALLSAIAPHRPCRWVKLAEGCQPTDCSAGRLAELLPFGLYGGGKGKEGGAS